MFSYRFRSEGLAVGAEVVVREGSDKTPIDPGVRETGDRHVGGMRPPVGLALLVPWWLSSVAERRGDPCRDLVVELTTSVENDGTLLHRLRFNGFVWDALKIAGGFVVWFENRRPARDLRVEDDLWALQTLMLEEVVAQSGLADASLSLVSLFDLSRRTWSTFLEVDGDVFRVREDGTLGRCTPERDERIAAVVLNCVGCRAALAPDLELEELAIKWLGLCRESSRGYLERHAGSVRLGFSCPDESEPVTTSRTEPAKVTVGKVSSASPSAATTSIETTESIEATVPVIVGAVAIAVSLGVVTAGLYAVRGWLSRVWEKMCVEAVG